MDVYDIKRKPTTRNSTKGSTLSAAKGISAETRKFWEENLARDIKMLDNRASILNITQYMRLLGLKEYGGIPLAEFKEMASFMGRVFFDRHVEITIYAPHGSAETIGSGSLLRQTSTAYPRLNIGLVSLDGKRSVRAGFNVGDSTDIGKATISFSLPQNGERCDLRLRPQPNTRGTGSIRRFYEAWEDKLKAAHAKGMDAVGEVLDHLWGELIVRPPQLRLRPLSATTLKARCRVLDGRDIRVFIKSGGEFVGKCKGYSADTPGVLVERPRLRARFFGTSTAVPATEIMELVPHRPT